MAKKTTTNESSALKKVGALVLAGVIGGAVAFGGGVILTDNTPVPIDTIQIVDDASAQVLADLTAEDGALTQLQATADATNAQVFKDDAWEVEAELLAEDEWSRYDYKDVFEFLDDIEDRNDIEYVRVVDTDFDEMDSNDNDGIVIQELKVRYTTSNGGEVNRYITVTTTLDDGNVETQTFA